MTVNISAGGRYRKLTKKRLKDYGFIFILLLYPVLQFIITWVMINVGSLFMAFKQTNIYGESTFAGFSNFVEVIKELFVNKTAYGYIGWTMLLNSLGYGVVTIFISLPLSLLFSYFLQKDMPCANLFRVIFFLPNIIPIVALVMAFNMPLDPSYGYLYTLMQSMGYSGGYIYTSWPSSQMWIYLYCIWAGLGYNVVLLSGAIGRIPKELFESARIDGAGYMKEFFRITVPLIWPTIVTLTVLGMTNVLTLYLHPYLLTNATGGIDGQAITIAMKIFVDTASGNPTTYGKASAMGLMFSVVWAPIIMLVRNKMSKKYDDVDF